MIEGCYEWWHNVLSMAIGIVFGCFIMAGINKR